MDWVNRTRRFWVLIAFILQWGGALGQGEIKVFGEQVDQRIILYASNIAYCPVSVKLELELVNMELADTQREFFVVPASTDKFRLLELRVVDPKQRISYRSRMEYVMGDVGLTEYDKEYVYDLPFEKGGRFMIFQGYNGTASHQNQFALDFAMPEGTAVLAAREGIVVNVQESNTRSCPMPECGQFNNFVIVYHADGSFAEYTHLQKDGAKVSRGDVVKKGTLIGLSGSTGWTSGPHLHFVCFLSRLGSRSSFPTKFRTGNGSTVESLEEKSWYVRSVASER